MARLESPNSATLGEGSMTVAGQPVTILPRVPLLLRSRAEQTMGMPEQATRWTADMVRALPDDGNRYEVVDGELLVTPAPTWTHQRVVRELLLELGPYARAQGNCEVLPSPADIELDLHGLVQPDVFVQGTVAGRLPMGWNVGAPLLLAIEVLSPSTARADRTIKRRRFQRARIPEYWIVDPDARVIERWRPDDDRPEMPAETIEWRAEGAAAPLIIDLPSLFARIHRERL
jgi:Uma2 family endonuclease